MAAQQAVVPVSAFERYLTLWVGLCIVSGVVLGRWMPDTFENIARLEIAGVNLVVGFLIWLMIIPMLLKVDFSALHQVRQFWRGVGITLPINWTAMWQG